MAALQPALPDGSAWGAAPPAVAGPEGELFSSTFQVLQISVNAIQPPQVAALKSAVPYQSRVSPGTFPKTYPAAPQGCRLRQDQSARRFEAGRGGLAPRGSDSSSDLANALWNRFLRCGGTAESTGCPRHMRSRASGRSGRQQRRGNRRMIPPGNRKKVQTFSGASTKLGRGRLRGNGDRGRPVRAATLVFSRRPVASAFLGS